MDSWQLGLKKFHLGVQDEWIFLLGKYRYKCTMYIVTFEAHLTNGQGSVFPLQSETTLLTTAWRFTKIEELVLKYHWKVRKLWSDLIKVINEYLEVY